MWSRLAAAGLLIFASTGCTPVTTRQARWREAGRVVPAPGAEPVTVAALGREAAALPAPQRRVVEAALGLVGAPGDGLDCSAFVAQVGAAAGLRLPRTAHAQLEAGEPVLPEDLRPGDLVFFAFEHRPADHVGVYVGQGQVVHVSTSARRVQLAALARPPLGGAWVASRRLAPAPQRGAARAGV